MLNALCFTIGGTFGAIWAVTTGEWRALRNIPFKIYFFGSLSLFGYHALYFSALRLAPAAEAGLIAYLWPLLIVLMSGLLPGERLRTGHLLGAFLAFLGATLIIGGGGLGFNPAHLPGYGLALTCAFTWSTYSVLSRRLGKIPTVSVVVFCLATAALSTILHIALEDTLWPTDTLTWLSIFALGLGPVGLAFYVWDVGVKRGDIQLLGTASYAAPLLSTIVLVLAGFAEPSLHLGAAALLITGGAVLAARASLQP
jgi:drug/metabolite transporter (DMT)-like permease